jgi:hypothetical protein
MCRLYSVCGCGTGNNKVALAQQAKTHIHHGDEVKTLIVFPLVLAGTLVMWR